MTPKTPFAAKDEGSRQLAAATIAMMNELIEIMTSEQDLVMTRKLDAHKQLLKRKQKLVMEYRAGMKSLMAQPELLKQLPENTRRQLKAVAQKLADTVDDNARMLRTAVIATQRLVQNIIAIVKNEILPQPGYQNPNTAHLELGNYSPTCIPVAVNRTV